MTTIDTADFEANAEEVAGVLKALANARRLAVMCRLVERGEASVGRRLESPRGRA